MKNSTDSVTDGIVIEILDSPISLPALPGAGTRLLEMARLAVEDVDVGEISRLIEADPGLYVRVLQLANSSYYGTINKIATVRQAIMHIGLEETLYSVQWLFYQNMLPRFPAVEGFSGKDYWTHAWSCAVANKLLGHPDLQVNSLPGELYLAGLFHGIGKLILALHRPDDFQQCIRNSREFSQTLAESEEDIFGTTDTFIASQVMRLWDLPAHLCAAVEFYRSPESADVQYQEIAALTQFAYYIANTSGLGNNGDEFCYDFNDTFIAKNWDSPLAEEKTRKIIVRRIYSTLHKKMTSVTGAEPPEKPEQARSVPQKPPKGGVEPSFSNTGGDGFWAWLHSLWRKILY